MRPLRTRLQEAQRLLGIAWEVLERDYVLSWALGGIGRADRLRQALMFQGSTALPKFYFGDYRLPEELDFSGAKDAPRGAAD